MTKPLIELVEEYGDQRRRQGEADNDRVYWHFDREADALLSEIRQRLEAGSVGVVAEYEFEVWQDGCWHAGGTASDPQAALNEANHYAMMYGQDGPVELRFFAKTAIAREQMDAAIDASRAEGGGRG